MWHVPDGVTVWPVYITRPIVKAEKMWPGKSVRTVRSADYGSSKKLPNDGSFRTFIERNKSGNSQFVILMFDAPKNDGAGAKVAGCIVDISDIVQDI